MRPIFRPRHRLFAVCALLGTAPCPAGQEIAAPNLAPDVKFDVAVSGQNLSQFHLPLQTAQLAKLVGSNLAEWGYPLFAQPASYRIDAAIGEIIEGNTPVGLSFSAGNSNPRSLDFQKAEVLPVSCRLTAVNGGKVLAEKSSTTDDSLFLSVNNADTLSKRLADEISTVCLTMLQQAPLPAAPSLPSAKPAAKLLQPNWLPNVRIEVRPASIKSAPAGAALTGTPVANGAAPANAEDSEAEKSEQVIINNRGTPVIFKFGPDRN